MTEIEKEKLRIIRLPEVLDRTGLSRSNVYLRISNHQFPSPISLGGRAVGWVESEIENWLEERVCESRQQLDL